LLFGARLLLAALFISTAYYGGPSAATLGGYHWPTPEIWSAVGRAVEFIFGIGLIFGIGTRYAAVLGIIYVLIATFTAHLWWTYPAQQQGNMYAHFMKNAAIAGGLLAIFVVGAGAWSVDAILARRK
jgi:putative oxidoreductase